MVVRSLWRGPALGGADLDFIFRPCWKYLGAALRHGRLPLWDPDMGTGLPFLASGQSQALYPPAMVLFTVLPLEPAVYIFSFGHLLWAAAGSWRAGRKIGCSAETAVAAAAFVAAAPMLHASILRPNMLAAASWLPWTFLAAERVAGRARGGIPTLAACVGVGLLCGSPEVTAIAVATAALPAFARAMRGDWSAVARFALGSAAGLGLAAAAVLPFAELLGYSSRGDEVHGLETAWSLGRGDFASFFLPFLHVQIPAKTFRQVFFGPYQGLLRAVYLGAPAAVFSGAALRSGGPRERKLAAVVVAAIVLAAWGGYASRGLERIHLAPLAFRYPVKFLYPVLFAVALLTAKGGEVLSAGRHARLVVALTLFGAALLFSAVAGVRGLGAPLAVSIAWVALGLLVVAAILQRAPEGPWRHWALVAACTADLTFCASTLDLASQTARCGPFLAAVRGHLGGGRLNALTGTPLPGGAGFYDGGNFCLYDNVPAQYGVPSVLYYGSPWPRSNGVLVERFGATGDGLIGTKLYLRDRSEPLPGTLALAAPDLAPLWAATLPAAAPRVELRPRARRAANLVEAIEHETLAAARTEVLMKKEMPPASAPGEPYSGPDLARLAADEGERLSIITASAAERWLVLADAYYPGWMASVDGHPAPIRVVYGMLRSVRLGPGRHRVVFEFHPKSFFAGVVISALTALALLAGTLLSRPRMKDS